MFQSIRLKSARHDRDGENHTVPLRGYELQPLFFRITDCNRALLSGFRSATSLRSCVFSSRNRFAS